MAIAACAASRVGFAAVLFTGATAPRQAEGSSGEKEEWIRDRDHRWCNLHGPCLLGVGRLSGDGMKLKDRVRITDLDVETDNPHVGFIKKLWLKYCGTDLEEEWALVRFDKKLWNKPHELVPHGTRELAVETSSLELL